MLWREQIITKPGPDTQLLRNPQKQNVKSKRLILLSQRQRPPSSKVKPDVVQNSPQIKLVNVFAAKAPSTLVDNMFNKPRTAITVQTRTKVPHKLYDALLRV